MANLSKQIIENKYEAYSGEGWNGIVDRVVDNVMGWNDATKELKKIMSQKKFIPGGRYLYSAGRQIHNVNNCIAMRAEDSREGWAELLYKVAMALQMGSGIGINYSAVRPAGSLIRKTGGEASGIVPLIEMVDKVGMGIKQGGSRRSALMGILNYSHGDIREFINAKTVDGRLSCTNISVLLDDNFGVDNYDDTLFNEIINNMYNNGEPGIVIARGEHSEEDLRNVCGEMTATYDSTLCNLGSINMGKINSVDEFEKVMYYAIKFLIAGSEYTHTPYMKCKQLLAKERRIGLGLMGVAEFLAKRNIKYGHSKHLEKYLKVYATATELANEMAPNPNITKTRAVAPNGTTALVAETTGGIEPVFCKEYIREYYNKENQIVSEHVIDPVYERLNSEGIPVESAYEITLKDRLDLQKLIQRYTDMAVSSTINFRKNDVSIAELKSQILNAIPHLKGLTVYPSGSRANEPIKPVVNQESCASGFCSS